MTNPTITRHALADETAARLQRASDDFNEASAPKRSDLIDALKLLHAQRRLKARLAAKDEVLTAQFKAYAELTGDREPLWDDEIADHVLDCPACGATATVEISGPIGAEIGGGGSRRWLDFSQLTDEEIVYGARHGLLQFYAKAADGLAKTLTEPLFVRFMRAVHFGGASVGNLNLLSEKKS